MVVANCSPQDHQQQQPCTRPPLLPSAENDNVLNNNNPRKPKSKNVTSRYMSPSPSTSTSTSTTSSSTTPRRFPSPSLTRKTSASVASKRSVSADRRRPDLSFKYSNGGEVSAATKMVVSSVRSLSVSFQGEAFAMPVSKTKVATPLPSVRRGTPERRVGTPVRGRGDGCRDQVENSKNIDQHRWPGRTRTSNVNGNGNVLSKSLNCGGEERSKVIGSGNMVRTLQSSLMDERRASFDGRLRIDLGNSEYLKPSGQVNDGSLANNEVFVASDLTASDTDSVSSGSTGAQDCVGASRMRNGARGIASSARFWQETNSRLRRLQDPGSPLSCSQGSKVLVPPKLKKFPSDNILSSPRTMSSPIRSARTASPSKLVTPRSSSPSRGMPSPSRVRNAVSTIGNSFTEPPSVLSYAVDVRRGKVGENRISDAHYLRLLYNRHLQWRFVNARTEESLLVQRHIAEKTLWGAWITISNLRDTVTRRRSRLQLLKQKLKLSSILKGHVTCLEEWSSLDKDHCTSLHGAIEALKASTLRLPAGGATADIHRLNHVVGSAIDVMQATLSSICSFLPKIEEVNSLVIELSNVTAKERTSLVKCEDFLSNLAALEVKDCSLRTQIIQQKRAPII